MCSVLCILFHCVVLCIVCVYMCTVLLPQCINPIAVKKICIIRAAYLFTYLLTPWSRVLLEKLTSKLCS